MWTLAFRNLFRHRLRSGLTLAAVIFGVTGLMMSGGFVRDIIFQLGEGAIHAQLGHVQIATKGYYDYGQSDPQRYMVDDAGAIEAKIRAVPDVAETKRRVNFSGLLNNGVNGGLLREGLARALDLHVGDDATLVVNTYDGALNTRDFRVVGIVRTMSRDFDARAVRIGLAAAQDVLQSDKIHQLVLRLSETSATDAVLTAVRQM